MCQSCQGYKNFASVIIFQTFNLLPLYYSFFAYLFTILTAVTQCQCASQTSFVTSLFHHFRWLLLFSSVLVSIQLAILLSCEAA